MVSLGSTHLIEHAMKPSHSCIKLRTDVFKAVKMSDEVGVLCGRQMQVAKNWHV